jgi:hypothetical protein
MRLQRMARDEPFLQQKKAVCCGLPPRQAAVLLLYLLYKNSAGDVRFNLPGSA